MRSNAGLQPCRAVRCFQWANRGASAGLGERLTRLMQTIPVCLSKAEFGVHLVMLLLQRCNQAMHRKKFESDGTSLRIVRRQRLKMNKELLRAHLQAMDGVGQIAQRSELSGF